MRYKLSQLIPVPMRIKYGLVEGDVVRHYRASWVQWRGRVFCNRVEAMA